MKMRSRGVRLPSVQNIFFPEVIFIGVCPHFTVKPDSPAEVFTGSDANELSD